tara:strand:+ start:6796 stop:7170 length:375 start_codon:yes stop_codon:yes gene_type:complete
MVLDKFCTDVAKYLESEEYDDNMIISLILRDVYLNDIIYVENVDKWKEYKKKSWEDFNMNFKTKISKIHNVLEKVIDKIIEIDDINIRKKIILKILAISKAINSENFDIIRIKENCKQLFNINI